MDFDCVIDALLPAEESSAVDASAPSVQTVAASEGETFIPPQKVRNRGDFCGNLRKQSVKNGKHSEKKRFFVLSGVDLVSFKSRKVRRSLRS